MMRLIAALSLAACLAGCAGRELRSVRCEWPSESAVWLDLRNPAQLRHFTVDPPPIPLEEYVRDQGRFRQLTGDHDRLSAVQVTVTERWDRIAASAGAGPHPPALKQRRLLAE